jgi:hypothetical protein
MTSLIEGLTQFFTPTHLLAVVALGLLLEQRATRGCGFALAAFALGLVLGSIVLAAAVREMPSGLALLAIAAIAGLIVVTTIPLPTRLGDLLAFTAGAALALNSPPQAISIPPAIVMQLGTGIAALATLALVGFIANKAERPWQRIAVRILGSWIAASAILVLALRLTR